MNRHLETLEFNKIIDKLQQQAVSQRAKDTFAQLEPFMSEDMCHNKMDETTAAKLVLESLGAPPLASMKGLTEWISMAEKGSMLNTEQLTAIGQFAAACKRMRRYLKQGEAYGGVVASYGYGMQDITELQNRISDCVNEAKVYDEASSGLRNARRKMEALEEQIKTKLNHILITRKQYLSDTYISKRNGHYVLPVEKRFQKQFGGSVIETSGRGGTLFMEPDSISKLQSQLDMWMIEEDEEIRKVLYMLTGMVAEQADVIRQNADAMVTLDVLFAKAKLSQEMDANPVHIGCKREIKIIKGRHPLLESESCVPLDFCMDEEDTGVVVTGPNTGGKTVCVKTVGLLSVMAQCGLHIPCEKESYIAMQDGYWCDIGDSQNISQNLSTFSGHMTNVIEILQNASKMSLVLLDELGSGTDPAEGMGIAVAVLEEFRLRGSMFFVTTHYSEVKNYAKEAKGIISARMAFDAKSLKPLYRLEMGKTGESCALEIAKRLGMEEHILQRAYNQVYGGEIFDRKQMKHPKSKLVAHVDHTSNKDIEEKFVMGDSVRITPENEIGIVYRPADDVGNVIVQVKGVKKKIRHTRLKLHVSASELYPPDYDFSIIFDSVENRKARHEMGRKFTPQMEAVDDEELF